MYALGAQVCANLKKLSFVACNVQEIPILEPWLNRKKETLSNLHFTCAYSGSFVDGVPTLMKFVCFF